MTSFSAALACTLDALTQGLLVCDHQGGVLHVNAALAALVRCESDRARLDVERSVAEELAARDGQYRMASVCRTVRTPTATYSVRGTYLGDAAFHAGVEELPGA